MTNETKQPTLPEAIALAREFAEMAGEEFPITSQRVLAALDSLQVGEPVAYGVSSINAIDGSFGWDFIADFEQAAHDHINDQIMRCQDEGLEVDEMHVVPLYTHPADCPRCAELEKAVAFNDETARHYLAGRTDALQKLAALEAELADRASLGMVMILKATIAQQAADFQALERAHDATCEQLAAAERDAERIDFIEQTIRASRTGVSFDWSKFAEDGLVVEKGYRMAWFHNLNERLPTLRASIDAAIAASREGKS